MTRQSSIALLATMFAIAGVLHFVTPAFFIRIVPAWVPNAALAVSLSGIAEIAGAIGLLVPATRRVAAWALIVLLVAVFPANVNMLRMAMSNGESTLTQAVLWARLPLQPLLMWWLWRATARR
ncbi:MAG: hypothetical protein ABIW79_08920 [Gemmatimonas sp.]